MAKMTADERRAWHEQAIEEGGSVFNGSAVIMSKAGLPSKSEMASTQQERDEALAEISQRRLALKEEEDRLLSSAKTTTQIPDGGGKASARDEGKIVPGAEATKK